MARKPKAHRCYYCENSGGGLTAVTNPVTVHDKRKGWLVEDGATVPLPASVRRLRRAAREAAAMPLRQLNGKPWPELVELADAVEAHERAVAKGRK